MKRFLAAFTLSFVAGLLLSGPNLQAEKDLGEPVPKKDDKPKEEEHARGRVAPTPAKMAQLHADAYKRNTTRVRQLPKVTAATFDCRALGWVGPVKDQKSCGSCWNFSGTGMAEMAYLKAGFFKPDGSGAFSEQYTMDCGRNGGCNGDDNTTVLDWAKTTGLPLAKDYAPYEARSRQCRLAAGTTLRKIHDWGYCTPSQQQGVADTQDIKNCMAQYGPIGTAVAAGGGWWNSGTGTDTGHSHNIDHDVILVGWDDNHDNGDGSKGAWIMRNSWGTSWGNDGYGWMKYGADDIGTEAVWCVATSLPPPPPPGPDPGPTPPGPVVPGKATSVTINYADGSTQVLFPVTGHTTLQELLDAFQKSHESLMPSKP